MKDEDGKYLKWAWPGGYPVYHLTDDMETMCADCCNDSTNPIHEDKPDDGWRIVASGINWEDETMRCVHCNKPIESAYGESDE